MDTRFDLTIEEAAALLRRGEVVAFPTETVYGLGADATSAAAIQKIFTAKGRPGDNPLIVHIGLREQLSQVVSEIPEVAQKLMDAFWPGPLTIILPKQAGIAENVTAGLSSVGVRIPAHPAALALLQACKLPIAAPSANVSGRPSPTQARHVADDLTGKLAGILDGGATEIGLESTVIDCTSTPPMILRPGGVTREQIEAVIGSITIAESLTDADSAPKSPGMKYTHYAPRAPLYMVRGDDARFRCLIAEAQAEGKRVGILVPADQADYGADVVLTCGRIGDPLSVSKALYAALREFDEYELDVIYLAPFYGADLGEAIGNRLQKASGHRVMD